MATDKPTEQPPHRVRKLPPGTPWAPFQWEAADVTAFQALLAGTAEPAQQRRALDTLIIKLAGTYEFHFHESQRDTDFALWVGRSWASRS